jgi:ADP-heptose:LPS heptosyltransferase
MRRFVTKWLSGIGLMLELAALALYHRKRLLVLSRFGGIGDIICTFPAVREMMHRHPAVQVVYVTRQSFTPLVRRSGLGLPCVGVAQQVLLPAWAIAPFGRHIHMTHADEDDQQVPPPAHVVQALGRTLGLGPLSGPSVLEVDPVEVERIRARRPADKRGIILLHTGPTWNVREWPLEAWTELVARLQQHAPFQILQIAADRSVSMDDASCLIIPGAEPVPCNDDITKLIHTVAAADLLIGIDSGPIHIAAAVNTPFISLFGPTDPARILPESAQPWAVTHPIDCSFCHHRRPRGHWRTGCPKDIACMKGISAQQVFEKSVELLRATKS